MSGALVHPGLVAMDPQLFITATFVGLVVLLALFVAVVSVTESLTGSEADE